MQCKWTLVEHLKRCHGGKKAWVRWHCTITMAIFLKERSCFSSLILWCSYFLHLKELIETRHWFAFLLYWFALKSLTVSIALYFLGCIQHLYYLCTFAVFMHGHHLSWCMFLFLIMSGDSLQFMCFWFQKSFFLWM